MLLCLSYGAVSITTRRRRGVLTRFLNPRMCPDPACRCLSWNSDSYPGELLRRPAMKTVAKRACLLTGFLLAAVLLPAQVGGAAQAPANQQEGGAPKGQRLFYASHSLMWYVPTPLGELADATGIKGHKLVGLQMLGASKTSQHWNLPEGKNKAKQALKKGEVDVFVMSPIQFPDEGIANFVKLGLEHNPNMRFVVQVSWGGWDIDNQDFPKGATGKVDRNKTPEQL